MAKFEMIITNCTWVIGEVVFEGECEVHYAIYGRYYPATHEQPEEYPEIEILKILDDEGNDVIDYILDLNELLEFIDTYNDEHNGRGGDSDDGQEESKWDDCGEY